MIACITKTCIHFESAYLANDYLSLLHNLQFPGKSLLAYVNITRATVYISNDETTVCLHCPTVSLSHPHFGYQSQRRWQLWLWLAGRWFFETIIDETDTTRWREGVRSERGGCKFKFFCSGGSVTATVCEMGLYGWVFRDIRRPRRPSKIGGGGGDGVGVPSSTHSHLALYFSLASARQPNNIHTPQRFHTVCSVFISVFFFHFAHCVHEINNTHTGESVCNFFKIFSNMVFRSLIEVFYVVTCSVFLGKIQWNSLIPPSPCLQSSGPGSSICCCGNPGPIANRQFFHLSASATPLAEAHRVREQTLLKCYRISIFPLMCLWACRKKGALAIVLTSILPLTLYYVL